MPLRTLAPLTLLRGFDHWYVSQQTKTQAYPIEQNLYTRNVAKD